MSRRLPWLALAAVALLAACESPTVPGRDLAYDFRTAPSPDRPALVIRWPVGSTIRVAIAGSGSAARDAELADALDHGARVWNVAMLYGEFTLAPTSALESADVVLAFSGTELPLDTRGCPPQLRGRAVTTFCNRLDPARLDPFPLLPPHEPGRVRMVVLVSSSEAGNPERLRRLVAHELGHVIGIANHSPDPQDLMTGATILTDTPTAADRQTAQILYHTVPDITP